MYRSIYLFPGYVCNLVDLAGVLDLNEECLTNQCLTLLTLLSLILASIQVSRSLELLVSSATLDKINDRAKINYVEPYMEIGKSADLKCNIIYREKHST